MWVEYALRMRSVARYLYDGWIVHIRRKKVQSFEIACVAIIVGVAFISFRFVSYFTYTHILHFLHVLLKLLHVAIIMKYVTCVSFST